MKIKMNRNRFTIINRCAEYIFEYIYLKEYHLLLFKFTGTTQ